MFEGSGSSPASSRTSTELVRGSLLALGIVACAPRGAAHPVAACAERAHYVESEQIDAVPLVVRVENKMSPAFEVIDFCIGVDEGSLVMDRSPAAIGRLAARGKVETTLRLPKGDHDLFVAMRIAGHADLKGKKLDLVSSHRIAAAALKRGVLVVRAFERDANDAHAEHRPAIEWKLVPAAP